eukprot:7783302-Pyramimonas_sp.AAC.1
MPVVTAPGKSAVAHAPSIVVAANALGQAVEAGANAPIMTEEGYSRSSEKIRTMEEITTKSSYREMKAMFDMADSGTESDTSILPMDTEDIPDHNLLLPHHPPAAVASFLDKKDTWTQQGQSLKRWHFVPRLVSPMQVIGDCPIDPEKLNDRRRTYAVHAHRV